VQRRDHHTGIAAAQRIGRHVLDHQQLQPVQQLGRGRLLLEAGHLADLEEDVEGLARQVRLQAGVVGVHDALHRRAVGEADVVEEAAAQEGVRQLLLVVAGDDDDRAVLGGDGLPGFVDEELHAVEFQQQVVRELDVGLVYFVNQHDLRKLGVEGVPQLAADDVVGDVRHLGVTELAVAQAGHGVVLIQALLRLGGAFHVPLDQRVAEGGGDLVRQDGLAGAGFPLD